MNNKEFSKHISMLSIKAMLYEVSATPKPGLVDRNNSGSHKDMDFFTFIDSSIVLTDYYRECTQRGIDFRDEDYKMFLLSLRPIGIQAEEDMFKATNGVNTHKGIIFSFGLIAASSGIIFNKRNEKYILAEEICNTVKLIVNNITSELNDKEDNLTNGKKLYHKYGTKGIRGEAESGFNTVLNYSLPVFRKLMLENYSINDCIVHTLLHLMANTEDSNILARHNFETLNYVKQMSNHALSLGGYFTPDGRAFVEQMDKLFIQQNISPGGSADLIAVTLLLYFIENKEKLNFRG